VRGPPQVLIVDDEPQVCALIRDGLADSGLRCTAVTKPAKAKQLLDQKDFNVMVTDIAMPEASGLDLLAHARHSVPGCKVILITGKPSAEVLAKALSLGAYDYFLKPFDIANLVAAVKGAVADPCDSRHLPLRAAKALEMEFRLRETALESIRALAQAVEAKDPYTRRHSDQVAHYARHLGRAAGLAEDLVESIRTAALLHDVGKIGIPDHILTKPGRLTSKEFSHVRRHPMLGFQILQNISVFSVEAKLVRHHHENWDGSGYPDGLAGEAIPRGARIINLADSIDAMLMKRTYKDAYSVPKMLEEIQRGSGTQFEPQLAQVALNWCRNHSNLLILPA
jgi:response regulator RpfG family c-di-GMP phosphodiesterase